MSQSLSQSVSLEEMAKEARKVLDVEAAAILDMKDRVSDHFLKAIQVLEARSGKVVLTGMGKSGIIARKIASTLSSTGTPAFFVHPGESSHGDLGMIDVGDVVLALSYSGETVELGALLNYSQRKNIPIISMTSDLASSLARASQVTIDVSVRKEACPLGLAPTASTTATLAMGDALAMALLLRKGFRPEDFAEFHPGGRLGSRLLTRVRDVMHVGEGLPLVSESAPLKEVVTCMTSREVRGIAGVVDARGSLIGSITDGDIRRRLDKSLDLSKDFARDLMARNPKTVGAQELAERAIFLMEEHNIRALFVVEDSSSEKLLKPVGLLHLQDLLRTKVR